MPDVASLSFNIDSSQAQRAVAVLETLKASSVTLTQTTSQLTNANTQLTQSYSQERDALGKLADQTRQWDGTLSGLISRLGDLRARVEDSRGSFIAYTTTLNAAAQAAVQFNATVDGLDRYVAKTRELNFAIRDTATGLANITAAQQNVTTSGQAARLVLDQLGVSLKSVQPNNPAAVVEQIGTALRTFRDTQATLAQAQAVFGPSFDAAAMQRLERQPYIPYRQRQANTIQAESTAQIDATRFQAQRQADATARLEGERTDLSGRYSQDATVMGRLGLNMGNGATRLFTQTREQELQRLREIDKMPAEERRAYTTYGAQIGDAARYGWMGQTWRQATSGTYSANEADIGARYQEDRRTLGFFPALRTWAGREVSNLPGVQSYVPRTTDERPLTPAEIYQQRVAAGGALAEYGDGGLLEKAQAGQRLSLFSTGSSGDDITQRYSRAYGADGGRRRGNQLATLAMADRYADAPEQGLIDDANRQRLLAALPLNDRAEASARLGDLARMAGAASANLPPGTSLQQLRANASLSPAQRAASGGLFQAGVDRSLSENSEVTKQQVDLQDALAKALQAGRGAAEDATRAMGVYNEAKRAGASDDKAIAQAAEAVNLALKQRATQATAATVAMKQQNEFAEQRYELAKKTSQLDPVTKLIMGNQLDIEQAIRGEISAGTLPNPAGGKFTPAGGTEQTVIAPGAQEAIAARTEALRSQQRIAALAPGQDTITTSRQAIADNRTLAELMEKQGISLERASAQLSLQTQLYAQLAVARASNDTAAIQAAEQQLTLATQLQRTAFAGAQQNAAADQALRSQSGGQINRAVSDLPPAEQGLAREMMPMVHDAVRSGRIGPTGGARRWIDRPEAQPYLEEIFKAADKYKVSPAQIAELIGLESQFDPQARNPDTTAGGLGQQIEGNTYLKGRNRFDPTASIDATAAEWAERLHRPGATVASAGVGYGVLANQRPGDYQRKLGQLETSVMSPSAYADRSAYETLRAGKGPADVQRTFDQQAGGRTETLEAQVATQRQLMEAQQAAQAEKTRLIAAGDYAGAERIIIPQSITDLQTLDFERERGRTSVLTTQTQEAARAANTTSVGVLQSRQRTAAARLPVGQAAGALAVVGIQQQVAQEQAALGPDIVNGAARSHQLLGEAIEKQTESVAKANLASRTQIEQQTKVNEAIKNGSVAVKEAEIDNEAAAQISALSAMKAVAGNQAQIESIDALIAKIREQAGTQKAGVRVSSAGGVLGEAKSLSDSDEVERALNDRGVFSNAMDQRRTREKVTLEQRLRDSGNSNTEAGDVDRRALESHQALEGNTEQMRNLREAAQSAQSAIEGTLDSIIVRGERGRWAFAALAQSLADIILKAAVYKPLENLISAGATSFWGSMFSSGTAATVAKVAAVAAAQGDTFSGPGIGAYSDQVVSRPTFFRFAAGAQIGQMGEAGPEAIIPLSRDSSGKLGIAGGGNTIHVNTPITVNGGGGSGGQAMDPSTLKALQRQLDTTVKAAVRGVMADQRRPGGDLYN